MMHNPATTAGMVLALPSPLRVAREVLGHLSHAHVSTLLRLSANRAFWTSATEHETKDLNILTHPEAGQACTAG